MNIKYDTDEYKIIHDERNKNINIIEFNSNSEKLIKSLTKTKIILGSTITDDYKTLIFKATSVLSLDDFLIYINKKNKKERTNLTHDLTLKLIFFLSKQLEYLITNENQSFYLYNPKKILVIDENKFIYLSNNDLINITPNKTLFITNPFYQTQVFLSPELKKINTIPCYIDYKSIFYSLGYLALYYFINKDIEKDNIYDFEEKIKEYLQNFLFKETKLYSFLERSLVEDPTQRYLLFI